MNPEEEITELIKSITKTLMDSATHINWKEFKAASDLQNKCLQECITALYRVRGHVRLNGNLPRRESRSD